MNFQDIPEELQVEIFGYCELKPLLEVCSGIRKIILANKCLNRKLSLDCDKILLRIPENCEDEGFYEMLVNRKFQGIILSTPTNFIANEIIERCRKSISRLVINATLKNVEDSVNCIENLKKFQNVEELEFNVKSDYRSERNYLVLSLKDLTNNMPKFEKLKKLKICSKYLNWNWSYGHYITTDLELYLLFENVSSLRELTLISTVIMNGKLILNQTNLKKLEILSNHGETVEAFRLLEVDEIRNNVKFQLDELTIENPRLFVARENLLTFILTQKQLRKFIYRQFYDDFYNYVIIPKILRHVLEMPTLEYLEVECERSLMQYLKEKRVNLDFGKVKICNLKEI